MTGFAAALRRCAGAGRVPVVPDFKPVSPAAGPLFAGRDMVEQARRMERAGAPALSVVTEGAHFGGSPALLSAIAGAVRIPVLRKDFIRTVEQVEQSARLGAQAVLLICACLGPGELERLYRAALSCGLEPLVETHTQEEMRRAAALGAQLVGVNNRDILALEKDGGTVATTARLAAGRPAGALLISESGIETPADVRAACRAGAQAVLVGTAIWRAGDPVAAYHALARAGAGAG